MCITTNLQEMQSLAFSINDKPRINENPFGAGKITGKI